MFALVTMLAATVAALMVIARSFEAQIKPPTNPAELDTFNQRLDLFNLALSIVLGIGGALIQLNNTPGLFANDTAFISANPLLFTIVAGLISVLPGGASMSLLSALLAWLGAKGSPPSAQAVGVPRKPRALLWN